MADHSEVNESLVVAGVAFMIAHQTARFDQPAESALHHPALGQYMEALGFVVAFDDAQDQLCGVTKEAPCLCHKGLQLSRIAAVGEDDAQPYELVAEDTEHHPGGVAILHAGGCHQHTKQVATGVGENVAFAPFDLFACVIAAALRTHGVGALHTLTVDDRRTGRGVFLSL